MSLFMTDDRMALLIEIHRAGPSGVAQIAHLDGELLAQHQLIERFVDPARIFTERYRTTWIGRKYAEFFSGEIQAAPSSTGS